jgi:hypothetical protein
VQVLRGYLFRADSGPQKGMGAVLFQVLQGNEANINLGKAEAMAKA